MGCVWVDQIYSGRCSLSSREALTRSRVSWRNSMTLNVHWMRWRCSSKCPSLTDTNGANLKVRISVEYFNPSCTLQPNACLRVLINTNSSAGDLEFSHLWSFLFVLFGFCALFLGNVPNSWWGSFMTNNNLLKDAKKKSKKALHRLMGTWLCSLSTRQILCASGRT